MSLILYYCHACGNLLRNPECEKALSLGESINTACCESCAKNGKRVSATATAPRETPSRPLSRQSRTPGGTPSLLQKHALQASTLRQTLARPAQDPITPQRPLSKVLLAAGLSAAVTTMSLVWIFAPLNTNEIQTPAVATETPPLPPTVSVASEPNPKPVHTPPTAVQSKPPSEVAPPPAAVLPALTTDTIILFGDGAHLAITLDQGGGAIQKQSGQPPQLVAPKILVFNGNNAFGPGFQYILNVEYSSKADSDVQMTFEIEGIGSRSKMMRFRKGDSMKATFTPTGEKHPDKKLLKVKIDPRDLAAGNLILHRIYLELRR
jgi:hypothetical protein